MEKTMKKILNEVETGKIKEINESTLMTLEESITSSTVHRTREAKLSAAIGAVSVAIAKKNNDPIYAKLVKHRKAWKAAKDQLVQKYSSIARQKVMSK
jgi:hypothetical protein